MKSFLRKQKRDDIYKLLFPPSYASWSVYSLAMDYYDTIYIYIIFYKDLLNLSKLHISVYTIMYIAELVPLSIYTGHVICLYYTHTNNFHILL